MQWRHTEGILCCPTVVLQIKPKVFVPPLPPLRQPSPPPAFLSSPLCVGRCSTLAVHVFTNVSEYLIVRIALSFASRRLSVRKAELHSSGYCHCYFRKKKKKKMYDYLFWSSFYALFVCLFSLFGRSASSFKSGRTSFRVDVGNLWDGGRGIFFIRHWAIMPTLWW